jgi:hypothetical protein
MEAPTDMCDNKSHIQQHSNIGENKMLCDEAHETYRCTLYQENIFERYVQRFGFST